MNYISRRNRSKNFIMPAFLFVLFIIFAANCKDEPVLSDNPQMNTKIIEKPLFLALGDSYTIGEGVNARDSWPHQLVSRLSEAGVVDLGSPKIIAKTGWRTDELLKSTKGVSENNFELVSLLIGVNNQYQKKNIETYKSEFEELLKRAFHAVDQRPERVLVLSIPDYGYSPFGTKNRSDISMEIDKYNEVNRSISQQFGVRYFDITGISRSEYEEMFVADNLHPSAYQYKLWVEKLIADKALIKMLKVVE